METQKFLGRFPIISEFDGDAYKNITLSDETGRYQTRLVFLGYPNELQISSTVSHEGIDEHLLPRIKLVRDLYNSTREFFVNNNLERKMNSERVPAPNFLLYIGFQGSDRRGGLEKNPQSYLSAYDSLIQNLCKRYDIPKVDVEKDILHDEKAVLVPAEHYRFEISKPNSHFPEFAACADSETDYERLVEFYSVLRDSSQEFLKPLIKIPEAEDAVTTCSFWISLDLTKDKELSMGSIRGLLTK